MASHAATERRYHSCCDDGSEYPPGSRPATSESGCGQRRDGQRRAGDDGGGDELDPVEKDRVLHDCERIRHAGAVDEEPGGRAHDECPSHDAENQTMAAGERDVREGEYQERKDEVVVALEGESQRGCRHEAGRRIAADEPKGTGEDE
jgi:hypothetical protein